MKTKLKSVICILFCTLTASMSPFWDALGSGVEGWFSPHPGPYVRVLGQNSDPQIASVGQEVPVWKKALYKWSMYHVVFKDTLMDNITFLPSSVCDAFTAKVVPHLPTYLLL